MSANLELVRSIYADWERGDFSRADWADPQIEFTSTGSLEDGSWTGVTALADYWRRILSAWDDVCAEAQAYREIDSERVLVLTLSRGRGEASGVELGQTAAYLFQIRNGKVMKLVQYWNRDRAFADLGLTPEGDPGTGS